MCGIFFSIGYKKISPEVIDRVKHRGPDGRGWNEFHSSAGPVIMAHRRLAIVDLSEDGHQPMSTEDGRYWITYNGEIYNYLEIRKDLEVLGHRFKTKTDTEVLLKSYLQWGEDCLNHFNGMFAFVIWDDQGKNVFAARDRFGVKPLYYYQEGDKIAFASEIKQFKHLPLWRSVLNQEMANEYLELGYCDHKHTTLYQNVFQVLPGHSIRGAGSLKNITLVCWYNLKGRIRPIDMSDDEAVRRFRDLFEDAVRLRTRSDVSVGACLSGGMDSSSIVSMLRHIQGPAKNIFTFSAVFPGHKVDESAYIDELCAQKKIVSYKNYPIIEAFLESLDDILYHQDLPFSGTSIFAQWATFQSAKEEGITVLLDGQGADESLLGYPGMLNGLIFDYAKNLNFVSLLQFLRWQSQYNNQSPKMTFLLGLQQRFPGIYKSLLKLSKRKTPDTVLAAFRTLTDTCLSHFSNNLQTLLRYEDRNSMAFSRESRLPFLDYRLVEFVLSLPTRQRFRNTETKWILRKAMEGININSILNRKDKIGFATPEGEWYQELKDMKLSSKTKEAESFNSFIFNRWVKNEGFQHKDLHIE
jgi:asparagine synthase (glutamine-hydrolysing)